MSAGTATPFAASPLVSMNPTSIEHDYRFPRRPADTIPDGFQQHRQQRQQYQRQAFADGSSLSGRPQAGPTGFAKPASPFNRGSPGAGLGDSLQELSLDMKATRVAAMEELLRTGDLPFFQRDDLALADPAELRMQDPLAIQVWKYFSKAVNVMPNQRRMENLTWRMMHTTKQKADEAKRYGSLFVIIRILPSTFVVMSFPTATPYLNSNFATVLPPCSIQSMHMKQKFRPIVSIPSFLPCPEFEVRHRPGTVVGAEWHQIHLPLA